MAELGVAVSSVVGLLIVSVFAWVAMVVVVACVGLRFVSLPNLKIG